MKKNLRKKINDILAKIGFVIQRKTNEEKIINLINKLHPVRTQYKLIRVGPNGDGGYLIPDDLVGIKACFSPGVDKISEFELWCFKKGMEIYLADKSVDSANLNIPKENYHFLKKYLGCTNNESFITMDEWVNSNISQKENIELLLQMDIEGGEYDTLISTSDELMRLFRVIVIEFHHLDQLWNPDFFHFAEIVFNKILQTHICVHIHPNNCSEIDVRNGIQIPKVAEFTFLRKDRAEFLQYETKFPNELDYDNTSKKSIVLPKNWYSDSN